MESAQTHTVAGGFGRKVLAFVLAAVSAYSFSVAIDILLGGLLGVYPSADFFYLPVGTWTVIATITVVVAVYLAPQGRFLAIPFALVALLALFGGIVGHRYNFIVAAVMLAASVGVWLGMTKRADAFRRQESLADAKGATVQRDPVDDLGRNIKQQFMQRFEQRFRAKLRKACIAAFEDAKATGVSETQVREQIAELLNDPDVQQALEVVFGDREIGPTNELELLLLQSCRSVCPKCKQNSSVVPIVYGLLEREVADEAALATVRRLYALLHVDDSKVVDRYHDFVAGGCCLEDENWHCRACSHSFIDREALI